MNLSLSKSLFTRVSSVLSQNDTYQIRLLYKLDSSNSDSVWICSYRNYSELTYKYFDSNFTIPDYLKFAGFLLNTSSNFDVNNLDTLNIPLDDLNEFYLLLLENDSNNVFSFNESFSCFKIRLESGNQVNFRLSLDDITWVEDDDAELKNRKLVLMNLSLAYFSKLCLDDETETQDFENGLHKMDKLPQYVNDSIVSSLKSSLASLESEEPSLPVAYSDPFESVNDKNSAFFKSYTLGFGFDNKDRKHAFVVHGEHEDCTLCFRLLLQNTLALPVELLDNSDDDISKLVLKQFHHQLSNLCSFLEKDFSNLSCFVSNCNNKDDQLFFTNNSTQDVSTETNVAKTNRPSGKKTTSNKRKNVKTNSKSTESTKKTTKKKPIFDFLPLLEMLGSKFSLNFDTKTGGLSLAKSNNTKETENEDKKTSLNLVFKYLLPSASSCDFHVPFGGTVVSFFDFLTDSNFHLDGLFDNSQEKQKLKFVFNPFELVDKTVLISPHLAGNPHPSWISPKKSTVYTVQGNYQYYHYTQCGVNDTGWGCCYRSLQLVCSWYFLQYHTTKPVPNHSTIQQVLKDNDESHKEFKIGSSTWIGTVESGYFLNWYLGYMYKTLYLSDVSEFRNYNVVISDHFNNLGTPIIVGAGSYAYVILGVCIDTEQGEFAYLIADPHYTGEDSVKNVLTKGGIGWKKIDFLSKAADGKFINLCLPLLEKYGA